MVVNLILGHFMDNYIRKCPDVVRYLLNDEKSWRNTLVLSTSLFPIKTLFTRDISQTPTTVAVVIGIRNKGEDLRIKNSGQLRIKMKCQENEIKEIIRIFNVTEVYVVIDNHLNLVDSKFEWFLRCFINTIDQVAKTPEAKINFFTFSRKSQTLRNADSRDSDGSLRRVNTTQSSFSCTENVISTRSMAGIFMSSVNMYLRTFKNLYNLQTRFGTDVYHLPHVTIHS